MPSETTEIIAMRDDSGSDNSDSDVQKLESDF
jgi:hypothetical protein